MIKIGDEKCNENLNIKERVKSFELECFFLSCYSFLPYVRRTNKNLLILNIFSIKKKNISYKFYWKSDKVLFFFLSRILK